MYCGLIQQLATQHQTAAHSPLPFTPQQDGEEKWTKGETPALRQRLFNKTTNKTLILLVIIIIIMIIMNTQNKLYTVQFSHCLTTDFAASPQAVITEPTNWGFCEFCKTPEKDQTHRKV